MPGCRRKGHSASTLHKELRKSKSGSRRDGIPQGRTYQLVVQYQTVTLKTHRQITLYGLNELYLGICITDTYMHAVTVDEKRGMDLKESGEEYMGRFGGRRGESKML